jgi:integrase
MATLIRYLRSRYWIAAFRDSTGRQIRQTTRETDKRKAQKVADILERTAKRQGNAQTVRQAFVNFYRDAYGEELPSSSVREYAASWLEARKAETTDSSYARYEKIIEKFLRFLGKDAERDLSDIRKPQIVRFRDAEAKKFATATANLELKTIRMMFRQARIDQYIIVDPAEGVKVLKDRDHDKVKRRPFTIDELRSILANADDEWQSLIKFGIYTGQRLADLATLRWSQIDLERDEIRLATRKTGKALLIPIARPLHEHLEKIADKDDARAPVHPHVFELVREQEGRVNTLSNQFTEILVAAGLRKARNHQGRGIGRNGKREGMDVSFHSLRHTAVSLLKDAGIPDAVVMALVGHDTVAMSQRYTHVGKEALANAAAKLPEL